MPTCCGAGSVGIAGINYHYVGKPTDDSSLQGLPRQHHRPRLCLQASVTERPIALPCAMPQPHQLSTAFTPLSGYITPIPCQYCRAEAHLIHLSPHPELNAELRTFECGHCGKQTELIVLR